MTEKKPKKVTAVSVQPAPQEVSVRDVSMENMLMSAIQTGVPVETLERLMAMRRELKEEFAEEQFNVSMAKFQAECPVIEKKKKVYEKGSTTKVRYSYAPLESIIEQVKQPLSDNGFSYDFDVTDDGKIITVVCKINHAAGHSKTTTFKAPIDKDAYMSEAQKYGAASTFARRYAFINGFGIATADEDTDATPGETVPVQARYTSPQAQTTPYVPKVYTQAKEVFDPVHKFKSAIGAKLVALGYDLPNMSKAEADAAVHKISGLIMSPENYEEITVRLDVAISDLQSATSDSEKVIT